MKGFIFLILCFGLSVQLSAADEAVNPVSDEQTMFSSVILLDFVHSAIAPLPSALKAEVENCFIIDACGQKAQYCDGGLHGPLRPYVDRLRDRFCGGDDVEP